MIRCLCFQACQTDWVLIDNPFLDVFHPYADHLYAQNPLERQQLEIVHQQTAHEVESSSQEEVLSECKSTTTVKVEPKLPNVQGMKKLSSVLCMYDICPPIFFL